MPLTNEQIEVLLRPIKPGRVMIANGQSHIPMYDVDAHLTRVFGFGGWDKEILSLNLVSEEPTMTKGYDNSPPKDAWAVTYSCTMRLTIKDPRGEVVSRYDDGSCGSSTQPQRGEAHDMAMKSAISYALKRCAKDLGDQFGLSLYNRGDVSALVGKTLVGSSEVPSGTPVDLESHIPTPESLGNDEREEPVWERDEAQPVTRGPQDAPSVDIERILAAAEAEPGNDFLASLKSKYVQYGKLTARQIETGLTAAERVLGRQHVTTPAGDEWPPEQERFA